MYGALAPARLALDFAAPDELAFAAFADGDVLGVVAAATAEQAAAVRALRRTVAGAARRTCRGGGGGGDGQGTPQDGRHGTT